MAGKETTDSPTSTAPIAATESATSTGGCPYTAKRNWDLTVPSTIGFINHQGYFPCLANQLSN